MNMSYQKLASVLSTGALTKLNPATLIASQALGTGKQISKEIFGYDFVGLMLKLFIFYAVAFIISKFFEAIILGQGAMITFLNLFGLKIPTSDIIPDFIKGLFSNTGVKGFKFWDIVKIISILLVTAEFFQYMNSQKNSGGKSSPMTMGLFTLIIIGLGLTTIPELIKRFKATDFNLESLR